MGVSPWRQEVFGREPDNSPVSSTNKYIPALKIQSFSWVYSFTVIGAILIHAFHSQEADLGLLELKRTKDFGKSFKIIGTKIYSFGLGGRFLFASVMTEKVGGSLFFWFLWAYNVLFL